MNKFVNETLSFKCCRLCKHSYFRDEEFIGMCKHSKNAYGTLPKRIEELHTCEYWEDKDGKLRDPREGQEI